MWDIERAGLHRYMQTICLGSPHAIVLHESLMFFMYKRTLFSYSIPNFYLEWLALPSGHHCPQAFLNNLLLKAASNDKG